MGRIEEALAKLQSQRANAADRTAPIGRTAVAAREVVSPAAFGGKLIEINFAELRRQGLLAPGPHERKLADEYRAIKRPLLVNASRTGEGSVPCANLLMVGSALSGEGKTFTCVNLALSIAREKDWSVVLVDADCAKPHLTQLFGAEGEPGLMDLLRDSRMSLESAVMPTDIPRLALLPAGRGDRDAVELLASARMSALCRQLASDRTCMVVFDTAPLLLAPEAPILGALVGQIVIVVRANSTLRHAVLEARDKLDPRKAIGLILNQADGSAALSSYGEYPYNT